MDNLRTIELGRRSRPGPEATPDKAFRVFVTLVRDQEFKQQNSARQTELAPQPPENRSGRLQPESGLLPIWNPDVFHLNGVVEEPTVFALTRIEPVDGPAFVRKHLL
jgi:hypothetical protein